MSNALETSKKMAAAACRALDSKKGEDIRVIDISEISVLADYFIIANGNSNSQVQALVDNVEEELAKEGYTVKQREGYGLFDKETRLFYDLERIWKDGKTISMEDLEK